MTATRSAGLWRTWRRSYALPRPTEPLSRGLTLGHPSPSSLSRSPGRSRSDQRSAALKRPNSSFSCSPRSSPPCCSDRLAAAVGWSGIDARRPRAIARRDPDRAPRLKWATYTSTRFIGGAAMGFAAQATMPISSEFGGLVAATFVGAIVSEILEDSLCADVTFAVHRGAMREAAPLVSFLRTSSLCAHRCAPRIYVCTGLAMDACSLPGSCISRPAPLRPVSGAATASRRLSDANDTLERANLSVRRRAHRDAGRQR